METDVKMNQSMVYNNIMKNNGVFLVSVPVRRTKFQYVILWYKILIRTPVNVRKYQVAG